MKETTSVAPVMMDAEDAAMATNAVDVSRGGWWERKHIRQSAIGAFKTAVAAVLCLWLGNLFGLTHSYWAAISAIVVMSSESAMSLVACRDRLIGTAIGAGLGWAASYAWHGHYLLYGLAVMVCLLACSTLKFEKAGRLAGVALTVIVLIGAEGGPGKAALARFLEVGLGIVVALVVTLVVFPERPADFDSGASR
jgi:uncharacterized membrane protein YgaE (UPF0421/DUF939 family)